MKKRPWVYGEHSTMSRPLPSELFSDMFNRLPEKGLEAWQDFIRSTKEVHLPPARAHYAIGFATQQIETEDYADHDSPLNPKDVNRSVFNRAVGYIANRCMLDFYKEQASANDRFLKGSFKAVVESRGELVESLYSLLNAGSRATDSYNRDKLRRFLGDASLIVAGRSHDGILPNEREGLINGLVAEYKVAEALRRLGYAVLKPTAKQDAFEQTDMFVNSRRLGPPIPIQVKSRGVPMLEAYKQPNGLVYVIVPSGENSGTFSLSSNDMKRLGNFFSRIVEQSALV